MEKWNNIDKNQKDTFKQFKNVSTSIDPFTEIIEIKKNYEFKLSKKINPTSWKQIYLNQNNNLNNFEYNNFNEDSYLQALFQWQPDSATIFYFGGTFNREDIAGTWENESSQIYMKFQYLFNFD